MSSLIFPLRNAAAADTAVARSGVLVPLRQGTALGSVQQRDQEVFKAVVAAVAVARTADALQVASDVRTGESNPGQLFSQVSAVDLDVVVAEIRRVQAKRAGSPTDEQRTVAAAVGADAVLVAAAVPKLTGDAADPVAQAALLWSAAVDATLLERAAHAAARTEFLDVDPVDEIKQLQDTVKKLQDGQAAIAVTLDSIDKRLTALEGGGQQQSSRRGGSPSGGSNP